MKLKKLEIERNKEIEWNKMNIVFGQAKTEDVLTAFLETMFLKEADIQSISFDKETAILKASAFISTESLEETKKALEDLATD